MWVTKRPGGGLYFRSRDMERGIWELMGCRILTVY